PTTTSRARTSCRSARTATARSTSCRSPDPSTASTPRADAATRAAHPGGGMGDRDILHVTTPAAWAATRRAGEIRPPSLATEGYVHCSTRAQLAATLERHFPGAGPLLALVIDADAVATDLH